MAKNKCIVYLGYEDEAVTDKNRSLVDYTTNKIGGSPDWLASEIAIPLCTLCGLKRLLIAQIYAPLENSQFHRTIYIFTCMNPLCSTQSQSWVCLRSQIMEKLEKELTKSSPIATNMTWCNDADDWGESENQMSISDTENYNEENGNTIKSENKYSDEEEESTSVDNDPIPMFNSLHVDDKNANCGAQAGAGAAGRNHTPNATAEIEGEESEMVTIETPIEPQRDIIALLKQTLAIPSNLENVSIKSFFVSVDEERSNEINSMNEHIKDLIQDYQSKDDNLRITPDSPGGAACAVGGVNDETEQEQYEKATPAHGDKIFYDFLMRIQENPGQILRYSRESSPLLIRPLKEGVSKCSHCGSDVVCEIQILPTLISRLWLDNGELCPVEFGNVLVFTCIKSCWDTPDRYRYENVIVQEET